MKKIALTRKNAALVAACLLFYLLVLGCAPVSAMSSSDSSSTSTAAAEKSKSKRAIHLVHIDNIISPPLASYLKEEIQDASTQGAHLLLIVLDTPGGLELAMRDIIKDIINAPLPVVVFVSPSGARAASAGAIITISAHFAAMAPGTNIGAAHPVSIGLGGNSDKVLIEKAQNDMVAYAQSIANIRGKNATWIEKAIRNSSSLTAQEAKEKGVIDFVATDVAELLGKLDGKKVELASGNITLATQNAPIITKKAGLRHRVLAALANPNISYILFLIGLAGLYFEFSNPGAIFPGVVGAISLLLAWFSMQTLPINFVGVALFLLAVILFVMEVKVLSNGILTIGGIISLVLGSLMLFESPEPALRVSLSVFIPALVLIVLFFLIVIYAALKAQQAKHINGTEGMLGKTGEAIGDIADKGMVLIEGEYWQAFSPQHIPAHSKVVVVAVAGLKLQVKKK